MPFKAFWNRYWWICDDCNIDQKYYRNTYLLADSQMLNMQLNKTCHNKSPNLLRTELYHGDPSRKKHIKNSEHAWEIIWSKYASCMEINKALTFGLTWMILTFETIHSIILSFLSSERKTRSSSCLWSWNFSNFGEITCKEMCQTHGAFLLRNGQIAIHLRYLLYGKTTGMWNRIHDLVLQKTL